MPILLIGLAIVSAVVARGSGVFTLAVINAIASFFSNGVMSNFGPGEANDIPDWAATVSIITTVAAIIFLIVGLMSR